MALVWNIALYLGLSILASPAATMRTQPSSTRKDRVLAMRAGMTPTAWAASSTVALETGNSRMSPSRPSSWK